MINQNELRIGNWVKSNTPHDGKIVKFKYFNEDLNVVFFYREWIGAYLTDVQPIPLTPEILEKCGFVYYDDKSIHGSWRKNGFTTEADFTDRHSKWVDLNSKKLVITSTPYDEIDAECDYLHQLQNLYFALTGEELKYTP